MDVFITLIVVMVSHVYTYIQNYEIVHFKYLGYVICISKERICAYL